MLAGSRFLLDLGASRNGSAGAGAGGEGGGVGDADVDVVDVGCDAVVCVYAVDGADDQLRLKVEESVVGTACPWVFGWCYPNGRRV